MEANSPWILRSIFLGVLAGGIHATAHSAAVRPSSITLCYEDRDLRPWRYRNGGGLNFQLLESAARQTGLVVRYEVNSWQRCLARLREGEVDGAFAASTSDDLESGGRPAEHAPEVARILYVERLLVVRRQGDRLQWDGHSLSQASGPIGVQAGYGARQRLRSRGVQVADASARPEELIQDVVSGRLGGAVILAGEIQRVLEHHPRWRSRVEMLPEPLVEKPFHLLLSQAFVRAHPRQAGELSRAIEETRASAAYRLLERRTLAALGQN